jgi:hypothetical protein
MSQNAYSSPAFFWAHSRVAFSAIKKNGEKENCNGEQMQRKKIDLKKALESLNIPLPSLRILDSSGQDSPD